MGFRSLGWLLLFGLTACGSVIQDPAVDGGGLGNGGRGGNSSGNGGTGGSAPGNLGEAPQEVQDGAALFAQNCQSCHGANAAGGPVYPGSLQGRTGIATKVRSGGGAMPAFSTSQLTDDEIANIESYLVWLADPGNGTGGTGGNLDPFTANCAGCHGATGEGTASAPQIRSPHEGYATWVVRNGRNTLGYPAPMPSFSEAQLGGNDLDEIFTFLQSQPMPTDGQGLYLRFCGNCHGPTGSGGVVGESAADDAEDRGEFFEVVRGGKGGSSYGARRDYMPGRGAGELSDAEVEKIRLFLVGSGGGGSDDEWEEEEDELRHGEDDDGSVGCSSAGGGAGLLGLAAVALVFRKRR